jgi:DNA-binding MarR family transcriptional regulator
MPEPEDHPEIQVFDEIARIEHLVRISVVRCLPEGLSYPQFEVLNRLVRRGDGAAPAEIAEALQASRSGFTNTLQGLERSGLVRVSGDDTDRRRKRLWLTPEGRRLYAQTMAALRPRVEALRSGLPPAHFRQALPFLRGLSAWMTDNP